MDYAEEKQRRTFERQISVDANRFMCKNIVLIKEKLDAGVSFSHNLSNDTSLECAAYIYVRGRKFSKGELLYIHKSHTPTGYNDYGDYGDYGEYNYIMPNGIPRLLYDSAVKYYTIIMIKECNRLYKKMEDEHISTKCGTCTVEFGEIHKLARDIMWRCERSIVDCIDENKHFEDIPLISTMISSRINKKFIDISTTQRNLIYDETTKICKDIYNERRVNKIGEDIKYLKKIEVVEKSSDMVSYCAWACIMAATGFMLIGAYTVVVGAYTMIGRI